jgi:hypothetical protein
VASPAFATAHRDAALAIRRASAALWTALRTTHRDISRTMGISIALHVALLLAFGSAMYSDGEDDRDIPELSVQLETRVGPNSEEFSEAALPQPAPEPQEEVIDDPGTSPQTLDAPVLADAEPVLTTPTEADLAPVEPVEEVQPVENGPPLDDAVLTTTGDSASTVASVEAPAPQAAPAEKVPEKEQVMLTKSVQQLAQKLLDAQMTHTELTWQQEGRQYSARVIRQPAPDSTGLEQVIAEVVTEKNGKRMKTHMTLKRLAFSHFTQLVNRWDPNIVLHDDVIDGRFHSNTEIGVTFAGGIEPRFFGKVTTAADSMTYVDLPRRRNKEVFQGGIETRTQRVTLPRDMPDVVNGGEEADRQTFADDTRIIFNADGSFVWRLANGEGPLLRVAPSQKPRYLIADKGAKLYVRGTVAGIFTVYSPTDIEIEGDIVYQKDPRDTVISRDYLALISGRDIRVASTQVAGTGDRNIQAALFARRRFCIESADRGKVGRLNILGSLTAGTILVSEPRYASKLDFDKRVESLRPASFPMTRRYEVSSWDEDWQEVEGKRPDSPEPGLARSE